MLPDCQRPVRLPACTEEERGVKILLADDHKILRDGLRMILEQRPGFQIVAEAADGQAAVAAVATTQPDVVVMDMTMPGLNGLEATRRIVADHPQVKVVGLSMHADRRHVVAMLAAGASGYLLKSATADELVQAIEGVCTGRTCLGLDVAAVLVDAVREAAPALGGEPGGELSSREREVLQLLAEGRTSKEIAVRLDIAVNTVETHRRQIMTKLNLRTIAELTKYAVREGLTPLER
jgi:DNA-binding NarL/FixJ family response regulator